MPDHKETQRGLDDNAIAIIGMSCRFPGADSVHQYWQNLLDGVESIQVEENREGRIHARPEIIGVENFDYSFFGFSFKEAQLLDPQHRLLLECAWEVIEETALQKRTGSTGVFCGAGPSSYFLNNIHGSHAHKSAVGLYHSSEMLTHFMATDKEFLASRIAYKFNCCGPAVNIQAACATSLFGIQAAIQSLLLGECDTALVGAAAVSVPQTIPYSFEPGMPFSADGHCRPFDAKATGTVFGSGAAVIALKRLEDALEDGDPIHSVVRSVATNNDGAHRAGMSAPSVTGQACVIREALDIAGINPEQITYIETHGTATPIGDPIEIKALANVFASRKRENTCYLGSVKGNIGHLGWAAGMAGLIKAVLIAKHRVIPPTINFQTYNPQLYIEETPFSINKQTVRLELSKVFVGVSSFGLGGNNSHLILECPTNITVDTPPQELSSMYLIPLSAKNPAGLRQLCGKYLDFLEEQKDELFSTFVANLWLRRSVFKHRAFVIASNRQEAINALQNLSFEDKVPDNGIPRIGLMFSGQGGEQRDMGKTLYESEPFFKNALDSFDPISKEIFGASAASLLFDPDLNQLIEKDITRSQPMTFALQVSMAKLLLSHGNVPVALLGHSLGEYAAACIAGVFSPDQGFRILVERSRLLDSLGDIGTMLVLACDRRCASQLIEMTGLNISIAALNSANNTVVSGSYNAIEKIRHCAQTKKVATTQLNISRPGHSSFLDPLLDCFEMFLQEVKLSPPSGPLISTLTGQLAGNEVASAHYWRRQLRETVNFKGALVTVRNLGCSHLIEVGAKATLSALVINNTPSDLSILPMARGGKADYLQYLKLLGALFCAGATLSPPMKSNPAVLDALPAYPFQRVRCWIEPVETFDQATPRYIYKTLWDSLALEGLDSSRSKVRRVLFLAPRRFEQHSEIIDLQHAFQQLHCVDLEKFINFAPGFDASPASVIENIFDGLLHEFPADIDQAYLDLRHLPGNDLSITVSVCSRILELLRHMVAATDHIPQFCLLLARDATENIGVNLSPLANSIAGMLRSILVEQPDWKVSILHFIREPDHPKDNEAGLIQLLPLTGEFVVSCQNNRAYVPRLEHLEIDTAEKGNLDNELSYLLIGGASGIGRLLIEDIISRQVRGVYVIGRSAEPREALNKLITQHANIHYLSLDLATPEGHEQFVLWLKDAGLSKVSIFNLAADLDDKLWSEVRGEDLARAFKAKCCCILNLYQILCEQGLKIELLFNFSSATSILGNGGQSAYGAASAFLDAAQYLLFTEAKKVLTVNWGVWNDAGKLHNDPRRLQVLKSCGLGGHSSNDGLAFIRQLQAGPSRISAFMNIQVEELSVRSLACAQFLERLRIASNYNSQVQPAIVDEKILESFDEAQSSLVVENWLISTINALVGLAGLTSGHYAAIKDEALKELGFDSLALVQLRNALANHWGLQWCIKRLHNMQNLSELHSELMAHILTSQQLTPQPTGRNADISMSSNRLSLQQTRWLSLIGKDYGMRIIPYLIHCPLNAEHCRAALALVLNEHKLLRTYFPDGKPSIKSTEQILENFSNLFTDLSFHAEADINTHISVLIRQMAQTLPTPQDDVTWKIHFIDVGKPFFIAILGVQHLEFDGKSLTLMFDRLAQCLYQLKRQQPLIPVVQQLDYSSYIERQQQYQRQQWTIDAGFFKGLYNNFDAPTVLPGHPGFSDTIVAPSVRHSVEIIGANKELERLARCSCFSVFNAILYVYAVSMAEVIGCEQLMISTINSGRGLTEFNDVIGPFTSPLPVPITIYQEWLSGISMVARTLDSMQSYPLMHPNMLIDVVPAFSGMAQDTYFSDLGINFLNYRHTVPADDKVLIEGVEILGPVSAGLLSGANIENMRRIPGLHLVVEINGDDLRLNFWFHSERFTLEQVRMWEQLMGQKLQGLLQLVRAADE